MFGNRNRKKRELLDFLEARGGGEAPPIPTSAIKALRGSRSQGSIADPAGYSQAYISELETGRRQLTLKAALKLAGPLGTTAEQLMTAEAIARLQRAALKGALDPQRLLDSIMDLAFSLPGDEVAEDVVEALVQVLKKAIATYDKGAVTVATKSTGRPRRDIRGRRIDDPLNLGVERRGERDKPDRDGQGYRRHKPFAPVRGRGVDAERGL